MSVVETKEGTKLKCDICGNVQDLREEGREKSRLSSAPIAKETEKARKSTEIIYEGDEERDTIERECPECGHVGAYRRKVTTTFAKAESKIILTCEECGYSWEG